jgi:hypothetical protein
VFKSSLKSIFISLAISLPLLFGGCGDDSDNSRDNGNITYTKIKSVDENQKSAITLESKNRDKNSCQANC